MTPTSTPLTTLPPTDTTIKKRQYRSTLSEDKDGNVQPTFLSVLNPDMFPEVQVFDIANSSDKLVIVSASATQDRVIIAVEGVSAA